MILAEFMEINYISNKVNMKVKYLPNSQPSRLVTQGLSWCVKWLSDILRMHLPECRKT